MILIGVTPYYVSEDLSMLKLSLFMELFARTLEINVLESLEVPQ